MVQRWDSEAIAEKIAHQGDPEAQYDEFGEKMMHRRRPCWRAPEKACLLEGKPILTSVDEFRWTSDGRLAGWTGTHTDCEGTSREEESLRWSEEMVEATGTRSRGPYVSRHRIDSQAVGRSDDEGPWSQTETPRKIVLRHESRRATYEVTIRIDEQGRPIEVTKENTRWTFEYDDGQNADHATVHWWLDSLLDAWPWPEVPTAGSGQAALERWTTDDLPLDRW